MRTSGTGNEMNGARRAARGTGRAGLRVSRSRPPHRGSRAFTLIEILVVVAISGILLAVAAVNLFPSDEQLSRRAAADVAIEVEKARDSAWFGGIPTSITFDQGSVRRWRLAGQEWEAQGAQSPPEVRVRGLLVDGQPLDPRERLVFLADGLGTPFQLTLEARGLAWTVEGDAAGAIRLVRQ